MVCNAWASLTYVLKLAKSGYLGCSLKMCTSKKRTTEIRRSQEPGVHNCKCDSVKKDYCNLWFPFQMKSNKLWNMFFFTISFGYHCTNLKHATNFERQLVVIAVVLANSHDLVEMICSALQSLTGKYRDLQGNPIMKTGTLKWEQGPCNENRGPL